MPTGWFGKISWTVFLHCKSTAIIWLHNTHENTPERKYKMPDYILQFFNSSYWALISNVFTAIGVISVILAIVRFVHNRRRKVMSPFRITRQITMLKWNVGMRFIRKYGPRRRRWDCGSQKLDSIVYLWHGNMEIMPVASYVRFADIKIQR